MSRIVTPGSCLIRVIRVHSWLKINAKGSEHIGQLCASRGVE